MFPLSCISHNFPIKPDIVTVTDAIRRLRKSGKFTKLLELVLCIGNILNAGHNKGQSFGFDIDFLPKLRDTKTADNSQTMLHFIANMIENSTEYDMVKGFTDDLRFVVFSRNTQLQSFQNRPAERAKTVAQDELDREMREVKKSLDKLEKNLQQVRNLANKDENDRFDEVMSGFYQEASGEYSLCTTLKGLVKSSIFV